MEMTWCDIMNDVFNRVLLWRHDTSLRVVDCLGFSVGQGCHTSSNSPKPLLPETVTLQTMYTSHVYSWWEESEVASAAKVFWKGTSRAFVDLCVSSVLERQ